MIRYTNEPGQPVGKPGKKLDFEMPLSYMESQFAFIAGYTSGGAPYGITWDELDPEWSDYDVGDGVIDWYISFDGGDNYSPIQLNQEFIYMKLMMYC